MRQNERVQPDQEIQSAVESIPHLHPVVSLLIWALAIYATVLGVKLFLRGRSDTKWLGAGLLIAVFGWAGIAFGWEYPLEIVVHDAEKLSTLVVPLLRTIMEFGLVLASVSLALVVLSNLCFTLLGSDLIRLQKAAMRFGLGIIGIAIIYQVHFAGQYSIRTLVLGVGGALVFVVGLGLQRTLTNLFSGFDLQADNVFQKGDMVQIGVGGLEGVVWDTSLRSTRVHTLDGQMLIVANGELLVKEVLNLDHPTRALRVRRNVNISYSSPPMLAKEVMLQVLKHDVDVLSNPAPLVLLNQYHESAIVYELRFWVADRRTMDETVDGVLTKVWYALHESNIEIPFPIRAVRMVDMNAEAKIAAVNEENISNNESIIARCPLFDEAHMSTSERRVLARNSQEIELKPGELAVRYGEQSDHMYMVMRGKVRVLPKGKEPVEIEAPNWFGEMALLLNQPRSADVVAGENGVTLLQFSKESVIAVLKRRPEFAKELRQISDDRRIASGIQGEKLKPPTFGQRAMLLFKHLAKAMKPW
ncbi:MAG: mechanosensitive ion channel [Planctomycetes bacterium]|nr:mechanosensitive ion channel [Planctomycetota bacterium]